jgi:hypothetical protein
MAERSLLKLLREDRQVRLKWSWKRISGGSHTRSSIKNIIWMLGSKGNAALVSFVDKLSCGPCIDAY